MSIIILFQSSGIRFECVFVVGHMLKYLSTFRPLLRRVRDLDLRSGAEVHWLPSPEVHSDNKEYSRLEKSSSESTRPGCSRSRNE